MGGGAAKVGSAAAAAWGSLLELLALPICLPLPRSHSQAVVLLVQHGPRGSIGLVLNRPTQKRMGLGRGADGLALPAEVRATSPHCCRLHLLLPPHLPSLSHCACRRCCRRCCYTAEGCTVACFLALQGRYDGLFNSRVYWGGPHADDALTLLHSNPRRRLRGSAEIPYGGAGSEGKEGRLVLRLWGLAAAQRAAVKAQHGMRSALRTLVCDAPRKHRVPHQHGVCA